MNEEDLEKLADVHIGSIYVRIAGGEYKVLELRNYSITQALEQTPEALPDATNYESNKQVSWVLLGDPAPANSITIVKYEQLEDGVYPKGTIWIREVEDFKNNFKIITS